MDIIDHIETDIKLSVDDVIHVIRTLRKDIDSLKAEIKKIKKPNRIN